MFIRDLKDKIYNIFNDLGIGGNLFIIISCLGMAIFSFIRLNNWEKLLWAEKFMYLIYLIASITGLLMFVMAEIFFGSD